jgi:hypothetical protein
LIIVHNVIQIYHPVLHVKAVFIYIKAKIHKYVDLAEMKVYLDLVDNAQQWAARNAKKVILNLVLNVIVNSGEYSEIILAISS